jgi:outer membrane protein assembly factor BamE (lipoprotein component of BamABCDE complex)
MKKITFAITSLLVAFSLAACGLVMPSTGDKRVADPSFVAQIKEGKSTTADVKELLGIPQTINHMGSETEWIYTYSKLTGVTGLGEKDTTLDLLFDSHNVLEKKNYSVSKSGL